tara:strand:- start:37 stop:447 length:411 start_codon:yes stop_codon:yes gene_type:complete
MKTDFTLILPILALMLSAPVLGQSNELRCSLDPDQHDTEASLPDHIFNLDPANSAVTFRTESSGNTESKSAFYVVDAVDDKIKLVSWLEKPGEVLILTKLVPQDEHSWVYLIGFPEDGDPVQMTTWGTCAMGQPNH